jgi:hypothetical protein
MLSNVRPLMVFGMITGPSCICILMCSSRRSRRNIEPFDLHGHFGGQNQGHASVKPALASSWRRLMLKETLGKWFRIPLNAIIYTSFIINLLQVFLRRFLGAIFLEEFQPALVAGRPRVAKGKTRKREN